MSNRYPTVTGLLMGLPLRRFKPAPTLRSSPNNQEPPHRVGGSYPLVCLSPISPTQGMVSSGMMGLGYPYPRVFKRLISLAPKPSFFGTMGPGIYHRPSLHPTRDTPPTLANTGSKFIRDDGTWNTPPTVSTSTPGGSSWISGVYALTPSATYNMATGRSVASDTNTVYSGIFTNTGEMDFLAI
jgi:hypothetical protein